MAAFCVDAQLSCKDTIYKKTVTKKVVEYDTTMNIISVVVGYDTTWRIRCNRMCELGFVPPKKVIDEVTFRYGKDTSYTYDSTVYTVTVTEDSAGTVCYNVPPVLSEVDFGLWGNGDNVTQKNIDALKPHIKGWNVRFSWKDFSSGYGVYNWKYIDDIFDLLVRNNLHIGFMIFVGDNSPAYIYEAPYNVPKVLTDEGGVYPFYKDDNYQMLVDKMQLDVANHLKGKYDITFWMSAEGSTGDEGSANAGYKGKPINKDYEIAQDWWTNYRHKMWTYIHSITDIQLLVNSGNKDKGDIDWATRNIGKVWFKAGKAGHEFNRDGEIEQVQTDLQFTANNNDVRFRTELEGTDRQDPTYNPQCATQQGFFALAANVDIFCIAAQRTEYLPGLQYFNKYAGKRSAANTTFGFCYMSGGIELQGLTAAEKQAYIAAGASTKEGLWWNDFATGILEGNYERFVHMTGVSTVHYRVSTNGAFGRYSRELTDAAFSLDNNLKQPSLITVVYLDEANSQININGTTIRGQGTSKQLTATIPLSTRTFTAKGNLDIFLIGVE